MCIMAYLAADVELPELAASNLNVEQLQSREQAVRCQFTLPNVVFISAGGCGCGFNEPAATNSLADEPRLQLVAWLRPILQHTDRVEMYSAWDGDQYDPREIVTEVTLSELASSPVIFQERQLVIIRPDSH